MSYELGDTMPLLMTVARNNAPVFVTFLRKDGDLYAAAYGKSKEESYDTAKAIYEWLVKS